MKLQLTRVLLIHLCLCVFVQAVHADTSLQLNARDRVTFVELLKADGQIAYLTEEKKSFVQVRENGGEYSLKYFIATEDPAAPFVNGYITSDSWMKLAFEVVEQSDGGSVEPQVFDPYRSVLEYPHYMFGEHVLPPKSRFGNGTYIFSLGFRDNSCDADGQNCQNEATLHYKITIEEIETPLLGDTNLDGKVAFDDFLTLASNFGNEVDYAVWYDGDFTQDGVVTMKDFLELSTSFGREKSMGVAAVPEPAVEIPLYSALVLLLVIRRSTHKK